MRISDWSSDVCSSDLCEIVADLSAGNIAAELRVALPDGLSQAQHDNLAAASAALDEITCSTIHGFCQRLIKSYPADADIDPGAGVMDRNQADLTFLENCRWLATGASVRRPRRHSCRNGVAQPR